jgi:hypothetical protein
MSNLTRLVLCNVVLREVIELWSHTQCLVKEALKELLPGKSAACA